MNYELRITNGDNIAVPKVAGAGKAGKLFLLPIAYCLLPIAFNCKLLQSI